MTPWIELEDLRLDRGGRPVLKGLSASHRGRAVGLVGANGAGKSSLIGALLGVLRHRSGSLRLLGLELPGAAMAVRTRCGVMAEQAGIFPGGSGVDAVAFAGVLTGLSRREALRRAHRALDALAVGEERYRPTQGYSTGMRQRCKLAMSLVHDPEALILDEPTVGLDPPGRAQLLALIRELRDQGRRILLSTHILPDAEQVCDEILLLDDGRAGYSGSVDGLTARVGGAWVAEGAGLDRAVADLRAAGLVILDHGDARIRFEASGDAAFEAFWAASARAGAEVRSLGPEVRSLEDAVIAVMEGGDEH